MAIEAAGLIGAEGLRQDPAGCLFLILARFPKLGDQGGEPGLELDPFILDKLNATK